jgi:hypothetical protein
MRVEMSSSSAPRAAAKPTPSSSLPSSSPPSRPGTGCRSRPRSWSWTARTGSTACRRRRRDAMDSEHLVAERVRHVDVQDGAVQSLQGCRWSGKASDRQGLVRDVHRGQRVVAGRRDDGSGVVEVDYRAFKAGPDRRGPGRVSDRADGGRGRSDGDREHWPNPDCP